MKSRSLAIALASGPLMGAPARPKKMEAVGHLKDAVEFGEYLRDLCAEVESAPVHDDRIQVRVDAEPTPLSVGTAIPLGMVANELFTNAVKYAYGDVVSYA